MEQIRLLLVDDHPVVRSGLRTVSEVDDSIVVVGEAATAAECLGAVRQFRPDALLLDVRLPDRSGLEVCRELKGAGPLPRILFLTSFADNDLVLAAMDAGADGYLLKSSDARDIAAALRTVMQGGAIFDPVVTRRAMAELARKGPAAKGSFSGLSGQEFRALEAIASGLTDKEAAQALGLEGKTIRNYLTRVFEKLGVKTRTQAALLYYEKFGKPPKPGEKESAR